MRFQRSRTIKNSYAPRYTALEYHLNPNFKKFEAISKKPISINDKQFVVLYIHKSQKKMIKKAKYYLKQGKIIYTGDEIIKV